MTIPTIPSVPLYFIIHNEDIPRVTWTNNKEKAELISTYEGMFTVVDTANMQILNVLSANSSEEDATKYEKYINVQEDTEDYSESESDEG
jgi:hypothetical protein